jgi:hypothetical protein
MFADTDGDGLDDAAEFDNGTDPDRIDTDGDTVSDARELNGAGDPTQFDTRAPQVVITRITATGNFAANSVTYTVRYRATDPSGARRVAFLKKGQVQHVATFPNESDTGVRTATFTFSGYETLLADGVVGPRVQVRTTDRHGNTDTTTGIGQNSFSRIAGFLGMLGAGAIDRVETALPAELRAVITAADTKARLLPVVLLATLSGISYGGGLVVKGFTSLIRNPEQFEQTLRVVGTLLANPGLLKKIPGALGGAAADAQRIQNPFPGSNLLDLEQLRTDALNVAFAAGWYAGAAVGTIGGELALGVVGGGIAGKLAVFDSVARLFNTARGVQVLVQGTAFRLARWTVDGVSTGVRVLDVKALAPAVSRLPMGRQLTVVRQVDALPDATKRAVADGGQEELLVAYLKRAGSQGRRLVERLPDPVSSRVLASAAEFRRGVALQRQLARQFGAGSIDAEDAGAALRRIDETSDPAVRDALILTVSEGGANGARLIARTDNLDAVKRLVSDPDVGADARTLIQRFDDPDTLEVFFSIDIDGVDTDAWRQKLALELDRSDAIRKSDVEGYANDIGTVERAIDGDVVEITNARGLLNEVVGGDDTAIVGQQLEAATAAKYVRKAQSGGGSDIDSIDGKVQTIEVEPVEEIDFRIEFDSGKSVFIETKNARDALTVDKIRREIGSANDKFDSRSDQIASSDRRVLTLGARRNGVADEVGTNRAAIRAKIKEQLKTFYPKNSNRPEGVKIDKIRIVTNDRTYQFDVQRIYNE